MDGILDVLHDVMSSPWLYALVFALAMLDGFFPIVPAETAVITAGVFAASGQPDLVPLVAVAAAGAFAGDHVSYALGRAAGGRKPTRNRAVAWARSAVAERGGLMLVVARYIPGGRTAVTLSMGALGYPRARFTAFDALAAVSWALYSALIGYFGGAAFEGDPVRGLLLGLGVAMSVTLVVEVVRHVRRRGRATQGPTPTKESVSPGISPTGR
ncbi:DedA family protein [Asanoa sp. WMMD1127]|uniref:DedA family protein n=1 Tax=Asanoa sp. WMMD1127 TaxID=3016107 RepID=UPI0024162B7E|nr:DedA family protein [Asanoa sp. WMMD1127]MDG4825298.1 DedA family protein [Asanoa sp. WMMD1127]